MLYSDQFLRRNIRNSTSTLPPLLNSILNLLCLFTIPTIIHAIIQTTNPNSIITSPTTVQSVLNQILRLGLPFASKKVFLQFLLATLLVVVVPIFSVVSTNRYLKDRRDYTELQKVAYTVIPALVLINLVIGVYIYRAIKDPQNYKKDPPLVIRPKKQ